MASHIGHTCIELQYNLQSQKMRLRQPIHYASREMNRILDETLMEKYTFASETLMEIAGLTVAQIAHRILKVYSHPYPRIHNQGPLNHQTKIQMQIGKDGTISHPTEMGNNIHLHKGNSSIPSIRLTGNQSLSLVSQYAGEVVIETLGTSEASVRLISGRIKCQSAHNSHLDILASPNTSVDINLQHQSSARLKLDNRVQATIQTALQTHLILEADSASQIHLNSRGRIQRIDATKKQIQQFQKQKIIESNTMAVKQIRQNQQYDILCNNQSPLTYQIRRVVVLVGPGNNGGDGLVAARHLTMMGHHVTIITFKKLQGKNGNYLELCRLCKSQVHDNATLSDASYVSLLREADLIIDALFGFTSTGEPRQPYLTRIRQLGPYSRKTLSVDIPSGWDADQGNIYNLFEPLWLLSLALPKKGMEKYRGEHYVGGRFVPDRIAQDLNIQLPVYPRTSDLFVKLHGLY